ncbi:MAG: SurA N-terminal domain-containing protein, partial [Rhabdaerophilum sp.]
MLNAIRTASSKWLGRLVLTVIMGFLIVSFAIWGIGDIFRGGVNRTVAKVGSASISAEEFRTAYNAELQRIQRQVRRVVTSEEARAFGLDRGLLNRQIDELALTEQARKLGMAVDQLTVMRSITEAPEFMTGGIFDRARLADALSQAGLSEQAFVQRQSDLLLRQQLFNGLAGGMAGAQALGKAVHQFRNEERNLDVILVPVDKVPAA